MILTKKSRKVSILEEGVTIEGTVSFTGELLVKGILKGTLSGDSLIIGDKGSVQADATVRNATIGGEYSGDIQSDKTLIILPTGRCEGNVKCRDLVVEPGGILNARVSRIEDPPRDTGENAKNIKKK